MWKNLTQLGQDEPTRRALEQFDRYLEESIEFGTFNSTFTAANSTSGTQTFAHTFTATPVVVATVLIGSNLDVLINLQTVSTTNFTWRLFQKSGTNISGTATVHWVAFDPQLFRGKT